jgi:predicted PurR-regulated permease PerM
MKLKVKSRTHTILLVVGFLFVVFLLWYFSTIVTYILISVVLSFSGKPLVHFLASLKIMRHYFPRGIAAFATLLVIWAVFFTFLRFMIPLLLTEINTFSQIDFAKVVESIGDPVIRLMQSVSRKPVTFESQNFFDILAERLGGKVDFSQLSNVLSVFADWFFLSFVYYILFSERRPPFSRWHYFAGSHRI